MCIRDSLNTADGKMSKSKGEFLTVSLLEEKGYDPLVYRFFCLQSHYRKGLVFSWENLDNAAAAFGKLIARIASRKPENGPVEEEILAQYREKFTQQVGNDLNKMCIRDSQDIFNFHRPGTACRTGGGKDVYKRQASSRSWPRRLSSTPSSSSPAFLSSSSTPLFLSLIHI